MPEVPLVAYHGDPNLKKMYLERVRRHRAADEIVQGTGWAPSDGPSHDAVYQPGKGCAVGCTLQTYDHSLYPSLLGVPELLARVQDRIFENLSPSDALDFPEQFLDAIPVGADLSMVWPRLALWMLADESHGVLRCVAPAYRYAMSAISAVVAVYQGWITSGVHPPGLQWTEPCRLIDSAWTLAAEAERVGLDGARSAIRGLALAREVAREPAALGWIVPVWIEAAGPRPMPLLRDQFLRLLAEAPASPLRRRCRSEPSGVITIT